MKSTCSNRLPLPNAGEGFWGVRGIPRRRTSSLKTVLDESPRSATEDIQLCVRPPSPLARLPRWGEGGPKLLPFLTEAEPRQEKARGRK